jgi:hypothetical protein
MQVLPMELPLELLLQVLPLLQVLLVLPQVLPLPQVQPGRPRRVQPQVLLVLGLQVLD